MKYILTILTLLICSSLVFAEGEQNDDKKQDRKGPRGLDFKGDRKFDRMRVMSEKFKEENPEKFAELEKLRQENPEEFRRQMKTMLQKKMGEHMRNRGMGERHWLHKMKEENPEKYEELMKLREEDPEAFRKNLMQEFSQRLRGKSDEQDNCRKEIGEILGKYREASSEEEKATLKEQLRAKMAESFENDLKKRMEMAQRLENHLNEVKGQIEQREAKKDSLIDEKIEYLIKGDFRKSPKDHKGPKKEFKRD